MRRRFDDPAVAPSGALKRATPTGGPTNSTQFRPPDGGELFRIHRAGQHLGELLEERSSPDCLVITSNRPGASPMFWKQCGVPRGPKAMPPPTRGASRYPP
jgi:hypothetical protein